MQSLSEPESQLMYQNNFKYLSGTYSAEWAGWCTLSQRLSHNKIHIAFQLWMEDTEVHFYQYRFATPALTNVVSAHVLAGWHTSWLQSQIMLEIQSQN